jgi:hypothetical protein
MLHWLSNTGGNTTIAEKNSYKSSDMNTRSMKNLLIDMFVTFILVCSPNLSGVEARVEHYL